MKKILLFLLLYISITSYAQLDREHWFAPMMDRVDNFTTYQSIYMSTNEVTPFKVDIYFNNAIVGSATISKNNPAKYQIPNSQRGRIITTSSSDLFRPLAMGFYLNGAKPFFASLRFSITNHGEIQTSKGTAALGTEFRAVMAPITVANGILNFMNSVMATEDNTTVTISEFGAGITFSDFTPRTQITFTLNKGQSYIVEGTGDYSQNFTGYIGAKIVSDKPIVIANGNFNGQYAGSFANSSDILMDQGVPIDKLGQEFVLMKGNGNQTLNMEKGLILATENNTEIYINNGTTPVATLNAGQYYLTNNTAYIPQGAGHFNMFIRATKNVYVYQLLAGANSSTGTEEATGGFNYIPPLNCYLPKKIDEIGRIDENEYSSNGVPYSLSVPTKLNIITERGATIDVKRNGVSLPLNVNNGPFDVLGNTNWVTYNVSNITGNIAVFSSKAVTAGISAGNDAVGYGGYFAGFSSIPLILKTDGDCLPGVKLEVTAGFDSYEWLLKVGANYVPAPGINNTFEYSPTQAGIYAVKVKQGSCPEIQTKDFKFYNCTTFTNYNYDTCTTQDITPVFALSTQTVNIPTIKIDTPPTKGTATVAANGTITYTAFSNATGTDTFKFSFCGNDPSIPDCETVQATINLNQIVKNDAVLNECTLTGIATYDLSSAAVSPDSSVAKVYYQTLAGAENQTAAEVISGFTNFTTTDRFVWVRMSNTFGCIAIARIELKSKLAAEVKASLYTKVHCDEDIDGVIDGNYKVEVSTISPVVLANPADHVIRYYDTQIKANAGGPDNIPGIYSFAANASVWIRVEPINGCPAVIEEINLNIGTMFSVSVPLPVIVCDNDLNNTENINLEDYVSAFTSDATATVQYFESLISAQNNAPVISATQTITGDQTFYYRFRKAGFCDVIGTLNISFKASTPSALLPATVTICEGSTTTLNVGSGYSNILWSNGATTTTINVGIGNYFVDLTNASGCVYRQNVSVLDSPKPVLNIAAYNATNCDENFDGIIEINLLNVTPTILPNAALFNIRYYSTQAFANAGGPNNLPNNFTYTTDTTIYVRVDSPVCPFITAPINFKFGPILPLNDAAVSTTVCDNDISGSENISLVNYRNLFTTDATATVQYFPTLLNAQNNTAPISTAQTITGDQTFYYRFRKAGFCDVIGTLNISFKASTPSALLPATVTICEGSTTTLNVGSGYSNILWSNGATTTTINVGIGNYFVDLTNASGCVYRQNVSVLDSPKPVLNIAAYNATNCDENFDGIIEINLLNITPTILPNAALFNIRYYSTQAFANAGGPNNLPNNFTYTTDTTIYVRVDSPVCPFITAPINFKFGPILPLNAAAVSTTVCDNDISGSENISLVNYRNLFTADATATVQYFATLLNAQNNTAPISTAQTINGDQTFYYRFRKAGFCDVIGTLNISFKASTPSALLDSYTVCIGSPTSLDAGAAYTAFLWKKAATTVSTSQSATLSAGIYTVSFTNLSGCVFTKTITILEAPKPNWTIAAYNPVICDDNFDGIITVNLANVTPVILPNFSAFTIQYFRDSAFQNQITDLANFSYNASTTIYVRATSAYCPAEFKIIDFKIGNQLPLIAPTENAEVCDENFDGIKMVDLAVYKNLFTTDPAVSVTYFNTLLDAQNGSNPIASSVTVSNAGTYYLRFKKTPICDAIGTLDVTVKIPKKSTTLNNISICPEGTVILDAGSGFDQYLWSTGETTATIQVPVGEYYVDLSFDGCSYRQNISVTAVGLPVINSVTIKGSTVTVNATGGNPPLQYAIDNGPYQQSNVFLNVLNGDHLISVISADNCTAVTEEINVIQIFNAITPNNDGINDRLDYSGLLTKDEAFLEIFDRYGKKVFSGDKNNRFTWDGTAFGRIVSTGTYWYVIKWKEKGSETITQYTGWVLVKNRE